MLTDVVGHVRADRIRIPLGLVQEPLHAIRGGLPGMLGQLPAVAALHPAKQPGDKPADPPAGLRTLEVHPDPVDEFLQCLGPGRDQVLGCLPDQHDAPTAAQSTQTHHLTQSKLRL
jgi:hypothetical protein